MVRILLVLLLLVPSLLWGANEKITEFTEQSTVVGTDIFPMVNDPGSTPVTKKMTINTLHKNPSFNNGSTSGGQINLLEDSDNGTDYSYIKGADDAGTNPSFKFGGSAAGSEDLTLTATANTWTVGTSTGVTSVGFGALNLVSTGTISGAVKVLEVTASCTIGSDCDSTSTTIVYGGMIYATGAATITLPTAVAGQSLCVYVKDASEVVRINPNASEVITLNGTALTAGIDIYSSGTAGDFICLFSPANGGWTSMGRSGTWTAGS